jgi:hypothetical protein
MDKNHRQIEPPAYLLNKIMSRIEREERLLSLKRRFFVFFSVFLGLFASLFPVAGTLRTTLDKNGFSSYFHLMFSDPDIVLKYSQNFFATLLETFPVAEVAVLLLIILVMMGSVKILLRDFRSIKNLQTA